MMFVTGDTHGPDKLGYHSVDGFMPRFNSQNFPEQKEMEGDDNYVVICGDFGGVWETNRFCTEEPKKERYALDWLDQKPFTTLVVPGNHENYDRLTGITDKKLLNCWLYEKMPEAEKQKLREGYPRAVWNGGFVRVLRPHVLMLEPGVFTIHGKKCFVYGGARCHDIQDGVLNPADYASENEFKEAYDRSYEKGLLFRVKGISWWEQEEPGEEVEDAAWKMLDAAGWKVDYVFTHDRPISDRILLGYPEETRIISFLERVKQRLDYRHWFFGHLHENRTLPGGKEHVLYEQLIRIM